MLSNSVIPSKVLALSTYLSKNIVFFSSSSSSNNYIHSRKGDRRQEESRSNDTTSSGGGLPMNIKMRHWENPQNANNPSSVKDFLAYAKQTFNENAEMKGDEDRVTDTDVQSMFSEWYLRKLEENKWNHFLNQMTSSRLTKPWDWDKRDPIPEHEFLHGFPSDRKVNKNVRNFGGGGSGTSMIARHQDKNIKNISKDGYLSIGDFEIQYCAELANEVMDDIKPPYLEQTLFDYNMNDAFEEHSTKFRDFFDNRSVMDEFQLNDENIPWIPPSYYDPHCPLPAYRNHESLLTIDPRNPTDINSNIDGNQRNTRATSIEEEQNMVIKHGIKPFKRQQQQSGVAYTPDFDFDLWSEDPYRPLSPINTYNFVPKKQQKFAIISRKQLPQRKRLMTKKYTPVDDYLIEFRWRSRMTRNQYQPSRAPTFSVIKIVGNGRGCAGLGFGRARSYDEAAKKAEFSASSNMIYLPRYRNHTLAHTLVGKFHNTRCVIEPKPLGYGERGPPVVKALCHAFGIRDYCARFEGKFIHVRAWTKIKAAWSAFLRVTTPEMDCEDRGQRMVEAYPQMNGVSYHLPRGWSHDNVQKAREILNTHQEMYENVEGFSQYDMSEADRLSLPMWIVNETAPDFWEGGMPDISNYKWRADLIDILQQKGPAGIDPAKEKQIQRLLAEKIDPCDHHFRWMKGMIKTGPNQAMGT